MLKKLLKYNLIDLYKFLSVFYLLCMIGAVLTRLVGLIDNSLIFNIIWYILNGFTISMMANVIINNIMRSWVRFRQNLYGDESYLTHTLPINKSTIFLSKFLSSFITMLTSIFIIVISLFIAYYSKENLEFIKNSLSVLSSLYNTSIITFILLVVLILFLELLFGLNVGFTGIVLGHKMNDKKILFSIIFGFIAYSFYQIIILISIFIIALFNSNIMSIFTTNSINDIGILKTVFILTITLYSLLIAINYLITNKLFKNGVNID